MPDYTNSMHSHDTKKTTRLKQVIKPTMILTMASEIAILLAITIRTRSKRSIIYYEYKHNKNTVVVVMKVI